MSRVAVPATNAPAVEPRTLAGTIADWLVLVRPRVAVFVVFAAFVGALVASGPGTPWAPPLVAALLVGCTAAAASMFNQVLERDTDALMERTADRPLVTGRLRQRDVLLVAAGLTAVGVGGLATSFGLLVALLALSTLAAYALVYTPLKRVSSLNTLVGAIPGAAPPLLGYAAIAGASGSGSEPTLGPWAWALFGIQFAWQFPHFLAIAWLYRADYARAGLKMLPALPGTEGVTGRQSLAYALVLLAISVLPAVRGMAGPVYTAGALVLGALYVAASAAFALRESRERARAVLLVSLVYLPLVLSLVLLDPLVRATSAS